MFSFEWSEVGCSSVLKFEKRGVSRFLKKYLAVEDWLGRCEEEET